MIEQAEGIEALRAEVAGLKAQVADLERRLAQNSRNSSRPPSSDGLAKPPAPKSLRRPSGRKPGGQPGHEGGHLAQVAVPDDVVNHRPSVCAGCHGDLRDGEGLGHLSRQVFDLPEIRLRVCEHRAHRRRCACGHETIGVFPASVAAATQYGPRVRALGMYLLAYQHLPYARAAEMLGDWIGAPLSTGTLAAFMAQGAEDLQGFLDEMHAQLIRAPVAHFDETGFRVAGKLAWVHSASAGKFALITVHPRRGRDGMDAAGVLPAFGGVAVHDAWAPYDRYADVAGHALCCAHALREFQAVTDAAPAGQWCWAAQVGEALREMKRLADSSLAIDGTLTRVDGDALAAARHRFRSAILIGEKHTAARAGPLMRKHHALARRLRQRQDDYLRFTTDPRVPFDNNAAEREIRMSKLRIKVSGCMRSMDGARALCAIRSYLSTAAKHRIGMLDALTRAAGGTPWVPEMTREPIPGAA